MPFKANASRRHHIPKQTRKVSNWADYNASLCRRGTWLLMGFFKTVPREVEEAAIVDGCSLLGSFFKMALPLSVPGILTVVIFTFTLTMQEFV